MKAEVSSASSTTVWLGKTLSMDCVAENIKGWAGSQFIQVVQISKKSPQWQGSLLIGRAQKVIKSSEDEPR